MACEKKILQSRPRALLCRPSKAHLVVLLFDHALRGKWAHVPATFVGQALQQREDEETTWTKQSGGNKKRGKRCLERGPGQTDLLLPESCSGANTVGWMYQADCMFAGLIPHTDRCHLGDSHSGPSKLPITGNGQCLGYSRDGPKQPTSGF